MPLESLLPQEILKNDYFVQSNIYGEMVDFPKLHVDVDVTVVPRSPVLFIRLYARMQCLMRR